MKLKRFLLAIMLISTIAMVVSCKKEEPKDDTLSSDEKMEAVIQEIKTSAEAILLSDDPIAGFEEKASYYKSLDYVDDVYVSLSGMLVKLSNGNEFCWLTSPEEKDTKSLNTKSILNDISVFAYSRKSLLQIKRACILNQFYNDESLQYIKDEYIPKIEAALRAISCEVKIVNGEKIDTTFLRDSLSGYDLIFYYTHGGSWDESDRTTLTTGQPIPISVLRNSAAIGEQLKARGIALSGVESTINGVKDVYYYYSITNQFIEKNYTVKRFSNSLFYTTACQSYKSDRLAKALFNKGVAAYVGWTEINSKTETGNLLLASLLSGATLKEAIDRLDEKEKVSYSQKHGTTAYLQYYPPSTAGNFRLVEPATADIELLTSSINFGNVTVGSSSATKQIKIKNTGKANLTITGIAPSFSYFQHTYDYAEIIKPGETKTASVIWTPKEAGTLPSDSRITFLSNANKQVSCIVSGKGVAATPGNQPPTAPVLVSPNINAPNVSLPVTFKWNASTDPENGPITYLLYVGTSTNISSMSVKYSGTATTATVSGLDNSKDYYWMVRAADNAGNDASSDFRKFTTVAATTTNQPPSAPVLVSPNNNATGVSVPVTFKWNASIDPENGPITYLLYVGTSTDISSMSVKYSGTSTTATVSLDGSKDYYWMVRAADNAGNDASSALPPRKFTTAATTITNQPPSAPVLVSPNNNATGVSVPVTFSWNASTDPENGPITYLLYVGTSTSNMSVEYSGTATTKTVSGLSGGTPYYWKVEAIDNAGNNTPSGNPRQFTTATTTPSVSKPAVTTGGHSSVTQNSATVSGNVTSDGGGTILERGISVGTNSSADNKGNYSTSGTTGSFSVSLTGLSAGTTHYAKAYARNSAGTSYGSVVSFTTVSSPTITKPTVTTGGSSSVTQNSATVSGNITSDGGGTILERGISVGTNSSADNLGSYSTSGTTGSFSVSLTGLSAGTTHYAKAYARNSAGISYGSAVSFTTVAPPIITLSSNSVTFNNTTIGNIGTQILYVTNTGSSTLNVSSITATGDFSTNYSSGFSLGAGAMKEVTVTFSPTATGNRSGSVKIYSNASNGTQTVSASGTGIANLPNPSFTPSVGTYTSCNNPNITGSGNCAGTTYIGGNIKATVQSYNANTNTITFRVQKCSGTFSGSGTLYLKHGMYCDPIIKTASVSSGTSYVDVTYTVPGQLGYYDFTFVFVSSIATGGTYYTNMLTAHY